MWLNICVRIYDICFGKSKFVIGLFFVYYIEYKVHAYNRNGLCAVGFMDDHYPVRSSFSVLNQVT